MFASRTAAAELRRARAATLVVCAALAATVTAFLTGSCNGPDESQRAGIALEAQRLHGRLSGIAHRSSQASLLASLVEPAGDRDDPYVTGVSCLLLGNVDQAITLLEKAAARTPVDARALNDLTVAYMERAARRESGLDLAVAFERAEDALRANPEFAPAAFNRAAILERLGLRSDAIMAWNECSHAEDEAGWANEARERAQQLALRQRGDSWADNVAGFDAAAQAGDSGTVRSLTRRFPQEVRMRFEDDLLAAWARGEMSLVALETISAALREMTGNVLPEHTCTAIAQTKDVQAFIRAHLAYADAIRAYRGVRMSEAASELMRAEQLLRRAGSPFAELALFYRAAALSYGSDASATLELLVDASQRVRQHGLEGTPLEAHIEWMRGKSLLSRGRPYASLQSLERALPVFERMRERDSLAGIHDLLAWNYEFLGDEDRAWSHYVTALTLVAGTQSRRRQRIILHDVADYAMTHAHPRVAVLYSAAALRMSRGENDPSDVSRSLLDRSRALRASGSFECARRDLQEARTLEARISDPALREDLQADVAVAEADLASTVNARQSLAALDRAIGVVQRLGRGTVLPRLWIERADEARKALRPQETELSLKEAIALVEEQRDSVADPDLQVVFAEEWYRAFDAMVDLLANEGRTDEALAFVERSRGRTFVRGLSGPQPSVAELASQLPAGVAVLVYASRTEATSVWIVRRDETISVSEAVSRAEVGRLVSAWKEVLSAGTPDADARRALGDLHRAILAPLATYLRAGERLVFCPDQPLQLVPFAALFDQPRGKWLIEDHCVSVTPSLQMFITALRRDGALAGAGRDRIAVLGDPEIDSARFPNLPRLRASAAEARAIARLYRRAETWIGASATRARLLGDAGQAPVVHVAAHAVANRRFPSRSALVLSPEGADDGILYAFEVEPHAFRWTRLVVLAACSTASSRETRYDGRLGLATSFLRAGVPEIVATLWDINDEASRRLSLTFHEQLRAGGDAPTALRVAQLTALRSPYESDRRVAAWAGYQLIGGFFER